MLIYVKNILFMILRSQFKIDYLFYKEAHC